MKTLSEKLREKMGHKVLCNLCGKKKLFNENWRMTEGHLVICPDCTNKPALNNKVLVSI